MDNLTHTHHIDDGTWRKSRFGGFHERQPSRIPRIGSIRKSPDARLFSSAVEFWRFNLRGFDDEKNGFVLHLRSRADDCSGGLLRAGGHEMGNPRSKPAGPGGD